MHKLMKAALAAALATGTAMTAQPALAQSSGTVVQGLAIAGVDQNSDAARKGLTRGDVIISANYQEISTVAQLESIIAGARSENRDAVLLRIQRRGRPAGYIAVRLR